VSDFDLSEIALSAQCDIAHAGKWGMVQNYSTRWGVKKKDETYQTGSVYVFVRP